MFAFTKQQKLVKTAQKLQQSSADLKPAYIANEHPDVAKLRHERIQIDRERIALHFDAIKYEIEDWDIIASKKDLWKLNKPTESEGTVFYSSVEYDNGYTVSTENYLNYKESLESYRSRGSIQVFFNLALQAKFIATEKQKKYDYWYNLTGEEGYLPSDAMYMLSLSIPNLASTIPNSSDIVDISCWYPTVTAPEMKLLAKYHHQNLHIIQKEHI